MSVKLSGHRGYKAEEIENTRKGFLRAIDEKLDFVECDVRKTRDKVLVMFHDPKINRLLNRRGRVSKLSLEQLRKFRYKNGETILSLEELFEIAKNKIKLILDVKIKGVEREIVDLINKHDLKRSIIVQSEFGKTLDEFFKLAPELPYSLYRVFLGNFGFFGRLLKLNNITAHIYYRFFIKSHQIQYISIDGPFAYDEIIELTKKNGLMTILGAMKLEKYLNKVEKWNVKIINANNPKSIKKMME